MTEMIKELFDGVTVFSLLKEFSVIISLIIGVPLGYKLSKWLRNNFVFWGTPVGLISAFVACIMVPVGVINFILDKGIDSIQYNLVELSKPKHIKYLDSAKGEIYLEDKMKYIKKSLEKEYSEEAVNYCEDVIIKDIYYKQNNDCEKYFEIVKPVLKEEDRKRISIAMYESLAVVEYNNQDYDKGMAYLEKIDKLGGKKEELSVYHNLEDMNKDSSEYDPLPGEAVQDNESKKEEYLQKLSTIEDEVSKISYDGSTLEMKEASSKILKKWDDALNEIYSALKSQLSSSDMELLKDEQRQWITIRDTGAEESASEFEGGTIYELEYIEALGKLTKERCYELVETYMK